MKHIYRSVLATLLLLLGLAAAQAQQAFVPANPNAQTCTLYQPCVLGVLRGANFNVTTDQAIVIGPMTSTSPNYVPAATKYIITEIDTTNCSTSLTTAQGGIYTAATKGGSIIGATTTPYTGCTGATFTNNMATNNKGTGLTNQSNLFNAATLLLSLTTAQGGAAAADVYLIGYVLN